MTEKSKDNWDKFSILTAALIPLVLGVFGYYFTAKQESINSDNILAQNKRNEERINAENFRDQENRKVDLLTSLISHLGSENEGERIIGIRVANHLDQNNQLPPAIGSTVIALAKSQAIEEAHAVDTFVRRRLNSTENNLVIYPKKDGSDVITPHLLVREIPGFDNSKPVYAACDINGWLVSGKRKANSTNLRLTTMKREGDIWKAYGMVNKRFHPAQLISPDLENPFRSDNIAWAKIENVYTLSESFVDMSGLGPSIIVK